MGLAMQRAHGKESMRNKGNRMNNNAKAYKIEILIIDLEEVGLEEAASLIESANYPSDCIRPIVMTSKEADIGEWSDDHPLNKRNTIEQEYNRLFP